MANVAPPIADPALRTLASALLDLYPLALGTVISEFEPRLFELLQHCVAFDAGWTGRVALTADGPVMHNTCPYRLPLAYTSEWEQLKQLDPVVEHLRHGHGRPVLLSATDADLPDAFRACVERYSLPHAMVCFHDDPVLGLHSFLALYRHDPQQPFCACEVEFMQAVMPHLASATNINRVHQIARIKALSGGPRVAVAICDDLGTLQFAEAEFAGFMLQEWPDWTGPVLPVEVVLAASAVPLGAFTGDSISIEAHREAGLIVLQARQRSVAATLTPRERVVTRLFAEGLTYKEVARRLQLSPPTIRHHLRNAYVKLGVQDKGRVAWMLSQEQ